MNNLKKFHTEADYTAATLNYPAVSWVTATDTVHFDKSAPTPTFSGLTVYYNISDISAPTELFKGGGGSGSGSGGSGSGSGSGGALPSAMIIDGTEIEPTNTYQFSTTGEHIVNYSFADNQISEHFLDDESTGKFSTVTKVEIGDAITSIGNNAFIYCTGLTSCTIGSGVTSIGQYTFGYCSSLISCTIGSGVTEISDSAFEGCSNLTSITIPNSVTSIGGSAFRDCNSLSSIDIPNSVTSIGSNTFSYCYSLTSIVIPSGVTSIDVYAFSQCSGLTSITSNATIAPVIQSSTFQDVKTNGTLTVPSGSSGYDTWMQNTNYYLGLYGWTKVEQ